MVDDIDPAAPPSEMQDLDCILEQDFGIEDIFGPTGISPKHGHELCPHYCNEVQGFSHGNNLY